MFNKVFYLINFFNKVHLILLFYLFSRHISQDELMLLQEISKENNNNGGVFSNNDSEIKDNINKICTEWVLEKHILSWQNKESSGNSSSSSEEKEDNVFSIENDEIEIPATIQEELSKLFNSEKQSLVLQIEKLELEKINSNQAFDKFRERARISLMKTASDQQVIEKKLINCQDEIILEKNKTLKAESDLKNNDILKKQIIFKLYEGLKVTYFKIDFFFLIIQLFIIYLYSSKRILYLHYVMYY